MQQKLNKKKGIIMEKEKVCLADGSPVTGDYRKINPETGMQKDYVVLTEEERSKGFVRPFRSLYIHNKCGTTTKISKPIAETYARNPNFYSGTYCCHCKTHFPLSEFNWEDGEVVGS